jgi:uncharacterized protein
MKLPFGRTKALEKKVDTFLDVVDTGMLALQQGIRAYLEDDEEGFQRQLASVSELERRADEISRDVETDLYTYSLIPDQRGDVLAVLEEIDNLMDLAKSAMQKFEVEIPKIPTVFRGGYLEVLDHSVKAADHAISAARSYFRDPARVKDDLNKVDFYESEADEAARRLKMAVFRSELGMARKQHLRYFAENVESLSDIADDVGALLAIATIRRSE